MGDTVIKIIRDVTLYLGEITLLPGEESLTARLKRTASQNQDNAPYNTAEHPNKPMIEPPTAALDIKPPTSALDAPNHDPEMAVVRDRHADTVGVATEELTRGLQQRELNDADDAHHRGDHIAEDEHLHHFLLVTEMRAVLRDLVEDPARRYNYGEWAWFLRLMGEDENAAARHRKPPLSPRADDGAAGPELALTADDDDDDGDTDDDRKQWSWIGSRSPLMADKDEPEWVLEHLGLTLERELKKRREKHMEKTGKSDGATKKNGGKNGEHRQIRAPPGSAQVEQGTGEEVREKEEGGGTAKENGGEDGEHRQVREPPRSEQVEQGTGAEVREEEDRSAA